MFRVFYTPIGSFTKITIQRNKICVYVNSGQNRWKVINSYSWSRPKSYKEKSLIAYYINNGHVPRA